MNSKKKAAVFILFGQSNAVGHGIPMEEADIIREPLSNVFGLYREHNQTYDNKPLVWSGYTSYGMNLGEEQDNTYSLANCLAKIWQDEADKRNDPDFPDLYIIHIAIGAQGVSGKYMWNPDRAPVLKPGKLKTVDISLYPLAERVLSELDGSLRGRGLEPDYIGLHWRGGEEDTLVPKEELEGCLEDIYSRLFEGFCRAVGKSIPIVLYRLEIKERTYKADPSGKGEISMNYINEVFEDLAAKNDNITIFDIKKAPHYVADKPDHGIYLGDFVHATPQTNKWIAETIISKYLRT